MTLFFLLLAFAVTAEGCSRKLINCFCAADVIHSLIYAGNPAKPGGNFRVGASIMVMF